MQPVKRNVNLKTCERSKESHAGSAGPVPSTHRLQSQHDEPTSSTTSRVCSPVTNGTQRQELLGQANRKLTLTSTAQNIATDRASRNDQARICVEFLLPVEEKERIGILLVSGGDGSSESDVYELVVAVQCENVASGSGGEVAETEFCDSWIARSRDFTSVVLVAGSGIEVEAETGWSWAREHGGHCGAEGRSADVSRNVRDLYGVSAGVGGLQCAQR